MSGFDVSLNMPRLSMRELAERPFTEQLQLAAGRATHRAALGLRDDIRGAMRSQRLGNLANAIAASSDVRRKQPRGRDPDGVDVAGYVYIRGKSERTRGALDAYVQNDVTSIAPHRGKWLAIATPELARFVGKGRGRRRMTPALYRSSGQEEKIGPLQFVPGRAGVAYLVVPDASIHLERPGRARSVPRNGRPRGQRARVGFVAFVLIRFTRRQRRVDPLAIAAEWQAKLPALMAEELHGRV